VAGDGAPPATKTFYSRLHSPPLISHPLREQQRIPCVVQQ
jgi:hypothetical protein